MPAWGPSPFGPLQLSVEDATSLGEIARVFVQDNMRSYEKYLYEDQRRLDERRWKLTKQRDGVHVYVEQPLKERRKVGGVTQDELEREYRHQLQRTTAGEKVTAAAAASLADLPLLLAVGTIAGTLDDAMYGAVNSTLEAMRVKSSYVGDNMADGAVLASIVEPTASDPFHSLTVKWMENEQLHVLKPVVKNRDFVYLEVTGLAELDTGERVGYHLLHSVDFPQAPELDGRVRANLSVGALYRQEREGLVDVYVRAILNPSGSIIRSLVVRSVADAIISVTEIAECAQKKKLAWLAKTSRDARRQRVMQNTVAAVVEANTINSPGGRSTVTSTTSSTATTRPSVPLSVIPEIPGPASASTASTMEKCTSCQKRSTHRTPSGSFVNTYDKRLDRDRCKLCYRFVCSSCRVKHKLTFIKPQGELLRRDLRFCGRCVDRARAADTLTIASEELASGEQQFAEFYQSLSPVSGESSGRGGSTNGM
ncbi:hypothetical protein PHYSODRAFT_505810 [Phytophthora sojae]|uniref:FYVE-type domain-containing protein n=1 Tax=Phytophthora sojae (strain P6497) TaxID=1094619 RepID=G4ZLP9_PHYSP|nr:hypothetical protein PHYSODRAFT_505810 [Phytophthora sojae]EGZ14942.1 hypothetical protein PHYSODRAFT_505810 [Phytophthora sojae]|eukprot:XP_009528691.1 hypothetical protein PHYSODRAFT_505810 [Phytophthora sojae]